MTYLNRQATLVRKLLQTILPQTTATAITPAAIRRNKKFLRQRIKFLSQMIVPATNRLHRKLRRIMVYTNIYRADTTVRFQNRLRETFRSVFDSARADSVRFVSRRDCSTRRESFCKSVIFTFQKNFLETAAVKSGCSEESQTENEQQLELPGHS